MNERNTNQPTMSSTQQQYLLTCEKCDSIVPDKYLSGTRPDELWVECSCGAHNGWYCPNHSPGNDCYDDEECDCCNPEEEEEDEEDPCDICIVCIEKYDYKNTGKMCLIHDPRDLRGEEEEEEE